MAETELDVRAGASTPPTLPTEQCRLGMAAAAVATAAALVLTVAASGYGAAACASTFLLAALAAWAYGAASGGRLQRGVAPLVMLVVAGAVGTVALVVFVDAWRAYDIFGGDVLGIGRFDFLRWALTSHAVLADYAPHAVVAGVGTVAGALTAVPRVRATLRAER